MAVIRTLSVSVKANTRNFQKGMKNARRSVKQFSTGVASSIKRIAGWGSALAAAAGGAGMILMVKRSMEMIDATAKMSDRWAIATEELTGLQHAAGIMGSSTEGMNKGLKEFVRRLGETATGIGETKDALDRMGLSGADLRKAGVAEAIRIVAENIASMTDATIQADAAYRLFGRTGTQLVNLLKLGREGIDALVADAKRLGATFNRIDAGRVEEANDAILRLRLAFTGIAQTLAIKFAPLIEFSARKITEWATVGMFSADAVASRFERLLKMVAGLSSVVDIGVSAFWVLRAASEGVAAGILIDLEAIRIGFRTLQATVAEFGRTLIFTSTIGAQALAESLPKHLQLGFAASMRQLSLLDQALEETAKEARRLADTPSILVESANDLLGNMKTFVEKAGRAWDKFLSAERSAVLTTWLDQLRAVPEMVSTNLSALMDGFNLIAKLPRVATARDRGPGMGREVDITREVLPGVATLRKEQKVNDPKALLKLEEIRQLLAQPSVAVTS